MDKFVDYYKILDVPKDASSDDIKKGFRARTKEVHPDVGGDDELFILVKKAFDILSNPATRRVYDIYYDSILQDRNASYTDPHHQRNKEPNPPEPTSSTEAVEKIEPLHNWWGIFVGFAAIVGIAVIAFLYNNNGSDRDAYPSENITNYQPSVSPEKLPLSIEPTPLLDSAENSPTSTLEGVKEEQNKSESQEEKQAFGLGSAKESVRNVMGSPDGIDSYEMIGDNWHYGMSTVDFNVQGKVEGWTNFGGNLQVSVGEIKNDAKPFTLGDTKQAIIDAMGTPDAVDAYDSIGDNWHYGMSTIDFDTHGRVEGWRNSAGQLKVFLGDPKSKVGGIKEGSTEQEVVDAMGTPDAIEPYDAIGDIWSYGMSTIQFNVKGLVKGWDNYGDNLYIASGP